MRIKKSLTTIALSLILILLFIIPTLASQQLNSELLSEIKIQTILAINSINPIEDKLTDKILVENQEMLLQTNFLKFSSTALEVVNMRYNAGTSQAYWGNYTGTIINKKPDGYGIWIGDDIGRKYDGYWKIGKRNGTGTYTWPDGSVYTGDWNKGLISGYGTYTLLNSSKYTGNWKSGKKQGNGTYTGANGDIYSGNWSNDKISGIGTYIWHSSGESYSGSWSNGLPNGKGKYFYPNGNYFVGTFSKGRSIKGTLYDKFGVVIGVRR